MARITDIELEELAEMADGWRANNRTIEAERTDTNDELTTITDGPVGFHGGNVKYSTEELASEARRIAYARKLIETYSRKGHI